MTKYKDEQWDLEGGFDEMLRDQDVLSYRKGVNAVIQFILSYDDERELLVDINEAIEKGII